jgi:hypothetical protein
MSEFQETISPRPLAWPIAATVAAVLFAVAWSIAPQAAPAGPVVSEHTLCDEARAGTSTLRMTVLVQQGAAVHGGVQVAASRYAAGQGLLSEVRDACTSVGA